MGRFFNDEELIMLVMLGNVTLQCSGNLTGEDLWNVVKWKFVFGRKS